MYKTDHSGWINFQLSAYCCTSNMYELNTIPVPDWSIVWIFVPRIVRFIMQVWNLMTQSRNIFANGYGDVSMRHKIEISIIMLESGKVMCHFNQIFPNQNLNLGFFFQLWIQCIMRPIVMIQKLCYWCTAYCKVFIWLCKEICYVWLNLIYIFDGIWLPAWLWIWINNKKMYFIQYLITVNA